jgi:hypothetical protein
MRPYRLVPLLLAVSFATAAAWEFAHARGGGLDSLGCHSDRKRVGFRCHRVNSPDKLGRELDPECH